jgi:hypothetical protein
LSISFEIITKMPFYSRMTIINLRMKINRNRNIKIYGVTFNGINDIISCAMSGKPKEGVFVGMDREFYPCFDISDYTHEYRYFWNFVFAKNKDILYNKLNILKSKYPSNNYRKFTYRLCPMIYFEGNESSPLEITIGFNMMPTFKTKVR